jgi:UDP-N-acetylglucosamine:LPS N-acetylglucosamine transferase
VLLPQDGIAGLRDILAALIESEQRLAAMAAAALHSARPEATRMIADAAVELLP